jgi:tetratricopeptide (TPR) repeat protein
MPSLNALGEFKFSFSNIANEKNDLVSKNLPYNDLSLPTVEAPQMEFSRSAPSDAPAENDFPDTDSSPGGLDFSDFLTTSPVDTISHLNEPPSFDDIFADLIQPSQVTDDQSSAVDDQLFGADDQSSAIDEQPSAADDQPFDNDDPFSVTDNSSGIDDQQLDEQALSDDFFSNLGSTQTEETPDVGEIPDINDFFGSGDDFSASSEEPAEESALDGGDFPALGEEPPADLPINEDDFSMGDLLSGDNKNDDFPNNLSSTQTEETPDINDFFGNGDDFSASSEEPAEENAFDGGDFPALGEEPPADLPINEDDFSMDDLPGGNNAGFDSSDFGSGEPDLEPEAVDTGGEGFNMDGFGSSNLEDDGIDMGGESPQIETSFDIDDKSSNIENPFDNFDASAVTGFEDFDNAGENANDNIDTESIDMGGESIEPGAGSAFDDSLPNTDFPDMSADSGFDTSLPDTDFPDMGTDAGFDTSLPDTDFSPNNVPSNDDLDSAGFDDQSPGDFSADLGGDFASESIELESLADTLDSGLGSDGFSGGDSGGDDFALPGLEDIFDKSKTETVSKPAPKKGLFKRKKAISEELPEAEANIEEIRLTQHDLDRLLKTLAVYPINLRIACEEMIAEQVLLPQQLSKLIRMLVNGAPIKEMAALAEEITGKPIVIPRGYEKMTGAAFEAEQASFAYIFVHNFLPVLRLFAVIAAFAVSVFYLSYRFIYIPIKAEGLYKRGYERIPAGEYQRANQLFHEAFLTHRKKKWFYLYAEAFRDERRYLLSEEKYDELLTYYPRDKKGVLDYAHLETYYLLNYDKASRLLQQQLLDYSPNDYDGLLAAGDNFLLWADSDPSKYYDKYEDARFSYARVIEKYGWQVPVIERMLKYFIRTDNLKEVLYLRVWFENDKKRVLSPSSLAELGGYLLDKQLAAASGEIKGVPDPYLDSIESVRDMLLQAVRGEPTLPEPHYHLARYYNNLGNTYEERLTLENAIRAFDLAQTESVRRRLYRVDTHYRYANLLVNNREFFPAEEQLVRGIQLYEDFLSRNLIPAGPQLGKLYAAKGDLEYFVKSGDMNAALDNYRTAERYGHSPPEIQYRMGTAYYNLQDWRNSLEYLFKAAADLPLNRRLLYTLGNVTYQRGDYFAAQGYYDRLIDILESQRIRLPVLLPNDNPQFLELGERLMMARNNAGVVYEALAEQTGNREFRSRAMALYAESSRAWDAITRDPQTMIRAIVTETPGSPGINLGFLNSNNAMRPNNNYRPEIFVRIDKDVLEPSRWEELATTGGLQ